MGQKTNPNILRLGKTKEWKSKYIEKKTTESSAMVFRNLEIRKFIFQLFAKNELQINNCKVTYSESSLEVYVSFYNSATISLQNTEIAKKKIKLQNKKFLSNYFLKKLHRIRKLALKKQFYTTKASRKNYNNTLKVEKLQNQYLLNRRTRRLSSITHFKSYDDGKIYKTLNRQNLNLFLAKILKSLSLFTNEKQDIFLNLEQLNNETRVLQKISHKSKQNLGESFMKLRKFQQNEFFKRGLNILYNFVENNSDPAFLAEFIAFYLKKLKRPNFFLRFLKIALKTLTKKNLSKFERIQIKIRGRFNGAPRSSHKFINIGKNIPVLTLNSKLDYGESTAYTSNGTFGIKVWTYITKKYHV